jgi:hypothetical protein
MSPRQNWLGVGIRENTDQLAVQWLLARRFMPETSDTQRQDG